MILVNLCTQSIMTDGCNVGVSGEMWALRANWIDKIAKFKLQDEQLQKTYKAAGILWKILNARSTEIYKGMTNPVFSLMKTD